VSIPSLGGLPDWERFRCSSLSFLICPVRGYVANIVSSGGRNSVFFTSLYSKHLASATQASDSTPRDSALQQINILPRNTRLCHIVVFLQTTGEEDSWINNEALWDAAPSNRVRTAHIRADVVRKFHESVAIVSRNISLGASSFELSKWRQACTEEG
jgi:hypothetical protein